MAAPEFGRQLGDTVLLFSIKRGRGCSEHHNLGNPTTEKGMHTRSYRTYFFIIGVSMAYWGYHAMFDCGACDKDLIASKENVYNFIKELVPAIDMVAFGVM